MRSVSGVFKSVPIAHEVHRANALPAAVELYQRGTITLGWEERLKGRARRTSDQGTAFATALPRGTVLREDDCLVLDTIGLLVRVVEQPEPVLVIRPDTPEGWATVAYFVGNSHQPLMVSADGLVVPDLVGMAQVLEFHRIAYARAERPFTPVTQVPSHRHPLS